MNKKLYWVYHSLALFMIPCSLLVGKDVEPLREIATSSLDKAAHFKFCYFTPPKEWSVVDPRLLSKRVKIGFIKKKMDKFSPSINLAVEDVSISQADYIKVVRNIHEADRDNRWRQLGKVHTMAGLADLTEIDSMTEWGPVRMLQLILVKKGRAYVLTAATLKDEMVKYFQDFQESFRSLQLTDDLLTAISQSEKRELLKQAEQKLLEAWQTTLTASESDPSFQTPFFQENHWLPFQKSILDQFQDLGSYWQILVLKDSQERLIAFKNSLTPPVQEPTEALAKLGVVEELEAVDEPSALVAALPEATETLDVDVELEAVDEPSALVAALPEATETLDVADAGDVELEAVDEPSTLAAALQEVVDEPTDALVFAELEAKEEDRLGEVAADPNALNLVDCSIPEPHIK